MRARRPDGIVTADLLLAAVMTVAALLFVYPYIGYAPVLRWLASRFPAFDVPSGDPPVWPKVTQVISAFNEAAVIGEKLRNTLSLDYPADKLEVLVVSDASSDATDDIVRTLATSDSRVRLLRMDERGGKTRGLNRALSEATGEIIVFSDANAMYRSDALRELVKPFVDSRIGYVVGAQLYSDSAEEGAESSEGLYWRLELALKEMESRFHSVVGGDGAIYAIRRELFWELRDDDINDFVNPLQIVAAGYRGVFNPRAACYEESAGDYGKEFGRKRRIVNRSFRAFRRYGGALQFGRDARFVFCLYSHKVIRWLALFFLAIGVVAGLALYLRTGNWLIGLGLAGVAASILVALIGRRMDSAGQSMPKPIYLCYYFYLVNLAAALGIVDEFRGVRHVTWDHVRGRA